MGKLNGVSLRAQWLGEWLRQARLTAGYKLTDVGEYLQMDHTSLSRFERGTHRIRRSYVKDLIDFYGIHDEQVRGALLKLSEDSWRKDWWQGNTAGLDTEFIDYTWLEARSRKMCAFEPMLIPGILQTRDYTTAIMSHGTGSDADPDQRARFVEARLARQKVLEGDNPVPLSVVIEEAPLHRRIGSNTVRRAQLEHLVELSHEPHIELHVLPISTGWHTGFTGPFRLFEMPDPYPDVAYFESIAVRTFLEDEAKVRQYRGAYDELCRSSLSPKRSASLIRKISKDLK